MKFRDLSIKAKLRLAILFVSTFASLFYLLVTGVIEVNAHKQGFNENLLVLAESTAYNSTASITFRDAVSAKDILAGLKASSHILRGSLYDKQGELFINYTIFPSPLPAKKIAPTLQTTDFINREGIKYQQIFHPVRLNGKRIGTLYLLADTTSLADYFQRYIETSLSVFTISFILTLILADLMQRLILNPLTRLTASIHNITTEGDYLTRVKVRSGDEIGELVLDFNKMLAAIAFRDQQLKENQELLEARVKERTAAFLAAKNAAEKASIAKTEFLSSMSHELRTPLNAVLGFAQLLETEELNEDQLDSVHEIIVAGEYLLELINKVLDLAKIESGHVEVCKQPTSLITIIQESLTLINPFAKKWQIKIHDEITTNTDIELFTDSFLLKQVIINLLSNAIKYNKTNGSVILSTEELGTNKIRINVTDTGRGLTEEQCVKIFQPFERLDAKNSAIEGTGVGLSICKQLVEAIGGSIGIDSSPGKGSCFYLELPLTASHSRLSNT